MGKKGKYRQQEEEELPKKKAMITEEHLMDKTHMDKTEFVPLLPSEALYPPFIYAPNHLAALEKIASDLNHLLYLDFKAFWATLLYGPTLKPALASCLSFLHRRWLNAYLPSKQSDYDFDTDEGNLQHYRIVREGEVFELTQGLAEVVLLIFHRMVSFNAENKELAGLYKVGEAITSKYLLDVPRLIELCELYGETNPDVVGYIVKHYAASREDFYRHTVNEVLPLVFKKTETTLRGVKNQTDREEYGINFEYKRMIVGQLSMGEEELKKKTTYLLEFVSFFSIIDCILRFFPENCRDHIFYNSNVQYFAENIFLELEVAYKCWNYQTQEAKLLALLNHILKKCIDYFVLYFERCDGVLLKGEIKTSAKEAYVKSLERIFKEFGRRAVLSRKNQTRNLLLYKIVQKEFDVHSLLHQIYAKQAREMEFDDETEYEFNMEYLKDIVIAFDS
jgi:hypothetical protein